MRLDMFCCVRMHWDAIGRIRTFLEIFGTYPGNFRISLSRFDVFRRDWTVRYVRMGSEVFRYIWIHSAENFSIQVPANTDLAETTFGRNYFEAALVICPPKGHDVA